MQKKTQFSSLIYKSWPVFTNSHWQASVMVPVFNTLPLAGVSNGASVYTLPLAGVSNSASV
ncbi:hypothetical protein SLEP1_g55028 [Rubroshorea leprosula]|uniref:Uncharacterized protein n=1 Tax=Rubroshorea leprosula TaxID=152421 RepID=A0AAV5MHZ2_9ROSI|nr:hypothetical protein SLEP1_g55028 [Rubroshorea leprosula]